MGSTRLILVTMFLLINPMLMSPVQQEPLNKDELSDDDQELHLHAAVNNLDAFLSEIQSTKTKKHPKDVSMSATSQAWCNMGFLEPD